MADSSISKIRKKRNDLTAEYLRSILDYNPDTGEFRWKFRGNKAKDWNTKYAGMVAGCAQRYWVIVIDGIQYYAHRLAWFHYYALPPCEEVDHINHDKLDNRIKNLRNATHSENNRNTKISARNTSGIKGVHLRKLKKIRYQVRIGFNGKYLHIGCFDTIDAAAEAYRKASIKYHGEFSRTE